MNMLAFISDPQSKAPIYHQLYAFIKGEIQSGKIGYNSRLPSKRKLSAYLQLSQNTIQAAYDQLIEEGYVAPVARKGFYVCEIENIVHFEGLVKYQQVSEEPAPSRAEYDFSYQKVDMPSFPFNVWRKLAREVINEYDPELIALGDPQGHSELRHSIAAYLHHSRGVSCSPAQIIISAGTEFLMQILIQLFGKKVVYGLENPGYEKLNQVFKSSRAKFTTLDIDSGGMKLSEILQDRADILCITPAHQFPSGEIMPINRRMQILNWANAARDRYIIEDDYDSEFKYSGRPIPAMQGLDSQEKVIYLGALSKSLSPAIRVSYMVLPPHLLEKYKENLSFINCPVPVIGQKILARFIREGYFERHLNKMRNIYRRKREVLVRSIRLLNCGIKVSGADAGLHMLLQADNGMDEEALVLAALNKGVKVYGISRYYLNKNYRFHPPAVLIGYAALSETDIKKAVNRLGEAWFGLAGPV